jgi:hypothetical protein
VKAPKCGRNDAKELTTINNGSYGLRIKTGNQQENLGGCFGIRTGIDNKSAGGCTVIVLKYRMGILNANWPKQKETFSLWFNFRKGTWSFFGTGISFIFFATIILVVE